MRSGFSSRAAALLVAAANGMGCGDDELHTRTLRDVGDFCVESGADGSLTFSVRTALGDPCLSGCAINTMSCRATLAGHRIELMSRIEIRGRPGIVECQSECIGSTASCELDAPPPGNYAFGFASRVHRATLPLEGALGLFGEHDCEPALNPP